MRYTAGKIRSMVFLVLFAGSAALFAQEFDFDDDAMFQDDMIQEVDEEEQQDRSRDLLSSDQLDIGGRLHSSLQAMWGWQQAPDSWEVFTQDTNHSVGFRLGADVFLDARPSESLRVFGKARTDYPFGENAGDGVNSGAGTSAIEIFELFSDVNWEERIFFRVGKQTVTWGTGYFWSPADVLSLVPIDVEEPEAEREGPLAIKASVPFAEHSLDMYLIGDTAVQSVLDLGFAARTILYINPVEFRLGTAYQRDNPARFTGAVTLPYGDIIGFGEGRISLGRAEQRLSRNADIQLGEDPYLLEDDDDVYLSGTIGFRWMPQRWNLSLIGQYLYQGEGYTDSDLLPLAMSALAEEEDISSDPLRLFGRHHSILQFSRQELVHSSISGDILWQSAWNDLSGLVSAGLNWEWFSGFSLRGSLHYGYGDAPSEFGGYFESGEATVRNPYGRLGAGLELRIGGGRF